MRARRGVHAVVYAGVTLTVLGAGALALDVAWMFRAQAQAQSVADAASQAAIVVLRQTAEQASAYDAAQTITEANTIGGGPGELLQVTFGRWVSVGEEGEFVADNLSPNAVRVRVGRVQGGGVSFILGRIFGHDRFTVQATSTSASRSLQFVLVMDITGSWGERDFAKAREAALAVHDRLMRAASEEDEVAMTIFTNRFGWIYTEFTQAIDETAMMAERAKWEVLNIASKAGVDDDPFDGRDCRLHRHDRINDFEDPPGGCYPDMPREYRDEPGTDHSTGIIPAGWLFHENVDSGARYRAMLILTDGRPNGLSGQSGQTRAAKGFVEDRWREYQGPVPRTANQIRHASVAATQQLWDELRVHTWVVSFIQDDWSMGAMTQGDGYYALTSDPDELQMLFSQIVTEMPLSIVE